MSDQRIEVDPGDRRSPRPPPFAVLYDPPGDVAIDAWDTSMSAEGSPGAAVDDRSLVQVHRDSLRDCERGENDVTVVVSAFGARREIAWTIEGVVQPPIDHVYGDRPEPIEGDAQATSDYNCFDVHETYRWAVADILPVTFESDLPANLGILARTAVLGALGPGAERTAKGGAAACGAEH